MYGAAGSVPFSHMAIMKFDHIRVVVDDLAAAIKFFAVLGMTIEGKTPI